MGGLAAFYSDKGFSILTKEQGWGMHWEGGICEVEIIFHQALNCSNSLVQFFGDDEATTHHFHRRLFFQEVWLVTVGNIEIQVF